jgi:hypothetical protein
MTRRNSSGEARRRKLLRFLENPEPAWREEDHPEFRGNRRLSGCANCVSKVSGESPRPQTMTKRGVSGLHYLRHYV